MLKLMQLGLARLKSVDNYRSMQRYIAQATLARLEDFGVGVTDASLLELGSGVGGYSTVLKESVKEFLAADLIPVDVYTRLKIPFVQMDVMKPFPFNSGRFDLIYCSSLIEHIPDPAWMLQESRRVLKPGGWLYLTFPPFYSLFMVGGHNFKPFHFFGEHLAISIHNRLHGTSIANYATCYGSYGLYPLRIDGVKELLLKTGFELEQVYTRISRVNTAKFPGILKDLATWHVCFLARKSA